MLKGILVSLLTIYFALQGVAAKPVKDISYVEGINFEYKNDIWTCGNIECPAYTFGCNIHMKTSEHDSKVLYQAFNCFDSDKTLTLGAEDRIELPKTKIINIDLKTYIGAVSVYSTGYGLGGHENARGVIAVDQLHELKETAKLNKKRVDSNDQFEQ